MANVTGLQYFETVLQNLTDSSRLSNGGFFISSNSFLPHFPVSLFVLVKDLVAENNKESKFRRFINTCSQEYVEMIKEFLDCVR